MAMMLAETDEMVKGRGREWKNESRRILRPERGVMR
jgi:hypothetical protein